MSTSRKQNISQFIDHECVDLLCWLSDHTTYEGIDTIFHSDSLRMEVTLSQQQMTILGDIPVVVISEEMCIDLAVTKPMKRNILVRSMDSKSLKVYVKFLDLWL